MERTAFATPHVDPGATVSYVTRTQPWKDKMGSPSGNRLWDCGAGSSPASHREDSRPCKLPSSKRSAASGRGGGRGRLLGLLRQLLVCAVCAAAPQQAVAASVSGPEHCPQLLPTWTNIAPEARITVSSAFTDGRGAVQGGCQAVDGIIGLDGSGEWVSDWEVKPSIKLEWLTARTINSVDLYDRMNAWPNLNSGVLSFSNGTTINVTRIPTDGSLKAITFAPKRVTWVKFECTGGGGNLNGLSEIAVGEVRPVTRGYAGSEQVNLVFWPGTRLTASTPFNSGTRQLDTKFGYDENNYWTSLTAPGFSSTWAPATCSRSTRCVCASASPTRSPRRTRSGSATARATRPTPWSPT